MSNERTTPAARWISVDALRGLAVLGMLLSGVVPWDGLPAWMYHCQEPPPSHEFQPNHAGITWVDLVFPFFLFTMGVAIPLALRARLARGAGMPQLIGQAGSRFLLLIGFAIFNQHLRPYSLGSPPTNATWFWGIWGFVVLIPLLANLPKAWPQAAVLAVRAVGWIGVIATLFLVRYPDGSGFKIDRADPIILVLATASFFGTLIWLATRENPSLRIFLWGALLVFRVSELDGNGWTHAVWNFGGPFFGLFQISFLGYLLVVLPGTLVGDWLTRREESAESPVPSWIAAAAIIPFAVVAMYLRWPSYTLLPIAAALAWWATRQTDPLQRRLWIMGAALVALGAILEPLEGGIKKDHPTLSYFILTPGLAAFALSALRSWEVGRRAQALLRFPAGTGSNPLLAYQALTNLFAPLWSLTIGGLVAQFTPGPNLGMVRAVLQMVLFGLLVNACTKINLRFRV